MKKLFVEEGLRINPIYLLNRISSINEENFKEVLLKLFQPGLFVAKLQTGEFVKDFSTELINPRTLGSNDYTAIKINISELNLPAKALTKTGKIISLNAPYNIVPYNFFNQTGEYNLFIGPSETVIEYADYLPNFTQTGEKKGILYEYLASIKILKKNMPIPDDYIQIASFRMDVIDYNGTYFGKLSNLLDCRAKNRAYLNSDLYDFYISDFLKHDYVIAPCAKGVGKEEGKIVYASNEVLKGTLTLYGVKNPKSKINVIFDGTEGFPFITFPDSNNVYVLYIQLTFEDFLYYDVLNKPLLIEKADTFIPHKDKIVLGVRTVNVIPTEIIQPEQNE